MCFYLYRKYTISKKKLTDSQQIYRCISKYKSRIFESHSEIKLYTTIFAGYAYVNLERLFVRSLLSNTSMPTSVQCTDFYTFKCCRPRCTLTFARLSILDSSWNLNSRFTEGSNLVQIGLHTELSIVLRYNFVPNTFPLA